MTRQVAFLRGINLGNRRVKMDRLRAHFEELGLEGVATYLASGNVVFDRPGSDSATLEEEIEEHLAGALGYEVKTFVRDLPRLDRLTGRAMFVAALGGSEHTRRKLTTVERIVARFAGRDQG